jgi:hypothetical protein
MHSEPEQAWLSASLSGADLHNSSRDVKAYVDTGWAGAEGPLPEWVAEVLDGETPIEAPSDGGTVLAKFVRDLPAAIADDTERRRVLRAALLAAAGRLGDRGR